MLIPRYSATSILRDLEEKMVFLSGPRQVGKTTLAKSFLHGKQDRYFNWDNRQDRREILAARWPAEDATLVFDELHKYRSWKAWIKGEFDHHRERLKFLITGSARLDVYRKGGDSLQGRYHSHRLHGLSVSELERLSVAIEPLKELTFPDESYGDTIETLFHYGGFPEPFLKQNQRFLRRWQREKMDRFLREDIRDLENVRDLSALELLADMLAERVGAPLSLQSLRQDLEVSHRAVSHWVDILERLYYCYLVTPYAHSTVRSLRKAPKLYLWDWSAIADEGSRFENLIAGHLLKMCHFLEDREGYRMGLHYLRDVSKREVDFLVTVDKRPWFAVECKMSTHSVNPALRYFGERLQIPYLYQVSLNGSDDLLDGRVRIMPAAKFLCALP
ncbi:MAG: ATP-binding protein [Deltaproteobacteria bacterium]|nr:ATP-binding protein [Deltaproteobacteria bacterium]